MLENLLLIYQININYDIVRYLTSNVSILFSLLFKTLVIDIYVYIYIYTHIFSML